METSLSHAVAEGSGPHAIGCVFPPSQGEADERPMGANMATFSQDACLAAPRLCIWRIAGAGQTSEHHQIGKSGPHARSTDLRTDQD